MARTALALILVGICTSAASNADAHISLDVPKSRYFASATMTADQIKQKDAPCGAKGDSRTTDPALITTFKPGERITVRWKETVQHPGHFRIAFDTDGQDFLFPGVTPVPAGVTVLVDDISDLPANGGTYAQEVTLPNVECSKCTLQLVQVMVSGSGPYKAGDLYFNCADLVLKADAGAGGNGGGGSAGSAAVGGGGAGAALGGASGAPGGGGTLASGGAGISGASAGRGAVSGGPSATSGGTSASGGTSFGTGGSPITSGTFGTGGAALGTGGAPSNGGATTPSAGGALGGLGGGSNPPTETPPDDGGGCAVRGRAGQVNYGALGVAAWLAAMSLRRSRRRARP